MLSIPFCALLQPIFTVLSVCCFLETRLLYAQRRVPKVIPFLLPLITSLPNFSFLPIFDAAICINPCVNASTIDKISFINGFLYFAQSANQSVESKTWHANLSSFVLSDTVTNVPCTLPPSSMNKSFLFLLDQCAGQASCHPVLTRSKFHVYSNTLPQSINSRLGP